ncbi:MAG: type I restriction endonuclease subunit R [Micropruina sp.]
MTAPDSAFRYEPIAISAESTVVAEFVPEPAGMDSYESESQLENRLIAMLREQAYEYLPLHSETQLVANLRVQLEALNSITFTDDEWRRFYGERVASANDGIVEKTRRIQTDHVQVLKRDDGTVKNIYLLDKAHIHNNRLQVINQYEVPGGVANGPAHANRYDVTILVNGLPLVHVELKRRGVDLREAFNQINRYARDSFWAGSGLFEYVQLFVISNGTLTKYYSNTTRDQHLSEARGRRNRKKTSNSYEFTSWWADANNRPITDLVGFTRTFFAKHSLLNVLTRFCVFDADDKLLVMRPYQIVAAEQILRRIETSTNAKRLGTTSAGGYVWHTTGSGKTLTSFKAAQLACQLPQIDKVLFVVDRKDLDYQTKREYDRFQKGAANANTSTRMLRHQLGDPSARIIVTTIQKLSRFVLQNAGHQVFAGHVVIIFDECHRSQFGDMHRAITKAFTKYHLFGFTGTPIFAANAGSGASPLLKTTEQAFGDRLHTYTIVDAIRDANVLPFRIDYVNTIKTAEIITDKQVPAIATEEALLAPERIRQIVAYIREHFDQKTKRNSSYSAQGKRLAGFNSLFATASIEAAKRYYNVLTFRQDELPSDQQLKVALIYSYAPNEAEPDGILGDEEFETSKLDVSSRDLLEDAIQDYNGLFGTSYDTSSHGFQGYYEDLTRRLKNRDLDLVIVVNMFLTGFDATTLNTLWVDKNLRQHGLLQAFSRTNRILNSVKTYGNIVSFRNLEDETNEALALFGNADAKSVALLKPYSDYYDEYSELVTELLGSFPPGELIVGEDAQKTFVSLLGGILRLRNILTSFDDFAGNEILTPRQLQDYQSVYLDLFATLRPTAGTDREPINDDIVFEIELIKQVEVNVDYILILLRRYLDTHGELGDVEARATIRRAIDSSPSLRNKKDLIEAFVDSLTVDADVEGDWAAFVAAKRAEDLDRIITEENLRPAETHTFIARAFRDGALPTAGTSVTGILPPLSRFAAANNHSLKKQSVLEKLSAFFNRYIGLA